MRFLLWCINSILAVSLVAILALCMIGFVSEFIGPGVFARLISRWGVSLPKIWIIGAIVMVIFVVMVFLRNFLLNRL